MSTLSAYSRTEAMPHTSSEPTELSPSPLRQLMDKLDLFRKTFLTTGQLSYQQQDRIFDYYDGTSLPIDDPRDFRKACGDVFKYTQSDPNLTAAQTSFNATVRCKFVQLAMSLQ